MEKKSIQAARMDEIYAPNPNIVFREEFEDCRYLFDPDTGEKYGLNDMGAFVWRQLSGRQTVKEIIGKADKSFLDIPDAIESDICRFLDALTRKGLVFRKTPVA